MSEEMARKFHDCYERLAHDYGYETRSDTREFDPESPNGALMIAVCAEALGAHAVENAKLKKQNERLKSRGIQDMQFEIAQWREAAQAVVDNSWWHHGTKCVQESDMTALRQLLEAKT